MNNIKYTFDGVNVHSYVTDHPYVNWRLEKDAIVDDSVTDLYSYVKNANFGKVVFFTPDDLAWSVMVKGRACEVGHRRDEIPVITSWTEPPVKVGVKDDWSLEDAMIVYYPFMDHKKPNELVMIGDWVYVKEQNLPSDVLADLGNKGIKSGDDWFLVTSTVESQLGVPNAPAVVVAAAALGDDYMVIPADSIEAVRQGPSILSAWIQEKLGGDLPIWYDDLFGAKVTVPTLSPDMPRLRKRKGSDNVYSLDYYIVSNTSENGKAGHALRLKTRDGSEITHYSGGILIGTIPRLEYTPEHGHYDKNALEEKLKVLVPKVRRGLREGDFGVFSEDIAGIPVVETLPSETALCYLDLRSALDA